MRQQAANKRKHTGQNKREHYIYGALVAVGLFLIVAASGGIIATEREYSSARDEYDKLSELYPVMSAYLTEIQDAAGLDPQSQGRGSPFSSSGNSADVHPDPLKGLREVNPDFIGWISIGDFINYPVVRGRNNSHYLNTTFTGQNNIAGAVFMDYKLSRGFDETVCILYGHNMRDGTIFAPLHQYRDASFILDHPYITIVTADGELLTYRIFAAKVTDVWDKAYSLNFPDVASAVKALGGAPGGADHFLLLSTCTSNSNKNERLLVYAALAP